MLGRNDFLQGHYRFILTDNVCKTGPKGQWPGHQTIVMQRERVRWWPFQCSRTLFGEGDFIVLSVFGKYVFDWLWHEGPLFISTLFHTRQRSLTLETILCSDHHPFDVLYEGDGDGGDPMDAFRTKAERRDQNNVVLSNLWVRVVVIQSSVRQDSTLRFITIPWQDESPSYSLSLFSLCGNLVSRQRVPDHFVHMDQLSKYRSSVDILRVFECILVALRDKRVHISSVGGGAGEDTSFGVPKTNSCGAKSFLNPSSYE